MDVGGDPQRALQWSVGAAGDWHVGDPGHGAHHQRVAQALIHGLVAVHDRDGPQVDHRARVGQEQGHRVVMSGVAVQDHRHGRSHPATVAARGHPGPVAAQDDRATIRPWRTRGCTTTTTRSSRVALKRMLGALHAGAG